MKPCFLEGYMSCIGRKRRKEGSRTGRNIMSRPFSSPKKLSLRLVASTIRHSIPRMLVTSMPKAIGGCNRKESNRKHLLSTILIEARRIPSTSSSRTIRTRLQGVFATLVPSSTRREPEWSRSRNEILPSISRRHVGRVGSFCSQHQLGCIWNVLEQLSCRPKPKGIATDGLQMDEAW